MMLYSITSHVEYDEVFELEITEELCKELTYYFNCSVLPEERMTFSPLQVKTIVNDGLLKEQIVHVASNSTEGRFEIGIYYYIINYLDAQAYENESDTWNCSTQCINRIVTPDEDEQL